MGLDDVTHDGKSKPGTERRRVLDETIEDAQEQILWDAVTVVMDRNAHQSGPSGRGCHRHRTTTRGVSQRIGKQVVERAA